MSLKAKIDEDLKAALLGGDRFKGDTLRGLKAAILNEEVAQKKRDSGLEDDAIEQLIMREVKKRHESAALYSSAGREELADSEKAEADIMSAYLPKQLSEGEISSVVDATIERLGVRDMSGMGQVIGTVKQELGNTAEGSLIASIVKNKLS